MCCVCAVYHRRSTCTRQCQALQNEVHNFFDVKPAYFAWVFILFSLSVFSTHFKDNVFVCAMPTPKWQTWPYLRSVWLITCCCSRLKVQWVRWARIKLNRAKCTIKFSFFKGRLREMLTWNTGILILSLSVSLTVLDDFHSILRLAIHLHVDTHAK